MMEVSPQRDVAEEYFLTMRHGTIECGVDVLTDDVGVGRPTAHEADVR